MSVNLNVKINKINWHLVDYVFFFKLLSNTRTNL